MTKKEQFGDYNLKGLKTFDTRDGYAYSATLCNGKVKVAKCENGGRGGPDGIHWLNTDEKVKLEKHVGKLPVDEDGDKINIEIFIGRLIDKFYGF